MSEYLYLEAAQFDQPGQWLADDQFFEVMGGAYLLAPGPEAPGYVHLAGPAIKQVVIPESGRYLIWVYTRDWLPEYSPGRFNLAVNGEPVGGELGADDNPDWHWQQVGEVEMAGQARLEVTSKGQYARFAAVMLSQDASLVPEAGWEAINLYRREAGAFEKAPGERLEVDVVVAGGGVAGICAALAASREGVSVAFVTGPALLGGNASPEIFVPVEGAAIGRFHDSLRETGVLDEVWTRAMELADWHQAATEFLEATTIKLLRGFWVEGVEKAAANRISTLQARDPLSGKLVEIAAQVYLDCTGDATLGALAGADYVVGRETQDEYGETLALPSQADKKTLSSSMMWRAEKKEAPVGFTPPPWAHRFESEADLPFRDPSRLDWGHWWIAFGGEFDTIHDAEFIRDKLLTFIYGVWDFTVNRSRHSAEAAFWQLCYIPYRPGKRESRRLLGKEVLTQRYIENPGSKKDTVAYGGWSIDLHPPGGILAPQPPCLQREVRPYPIPLRALMSRNICNLLMAGRNISCTHVAFGSTRVMATCAVEAQAVGVAAAVMVRRGLACTGISDPDYDEVQQRLLQTGAWLPDIPLHNLADRAPEAQVTASSVWATEYFDRAVAEREAAICAQLAEAPWQATVPLSRSICPLFEAQGDFLEQLELLVEGEAGTTLSGALVELRPGAEVTISRKLGEYSTSLETTGRQWITFDTAIKAFPGRCYGLLLAPVEGAALPLLEWAPAGWHGAAAVGAELQYFRWRFGLLTQPKVVTAGAFAPRQVTGLWPRPDSRCYNGWRSDPRLALPQWIELTFPRSVRASKISLAFDNDLLSRHPRAAGPHRCVKRYRLVGVTSSGEERELVAVDGNKLHWRDHTFAPIELSRLRLVCEETWGDPSARVFQVRVFGEEG